MSNFTNDNNTNSVQTMINGFTKESATSMLNRMMNVLTENGDLTFGEMGENTPSSALMELDHIMVRPIHDNIIKLDEITKSNKHIVYPTVTLGNDFVTKLDEKFNLFISRTSSLPLNEQKKWWSLMFRYAFYVRNLRGVGKRERLLFYYIFGKIYNHYPKTTLALIDQIPNFGYFGDFNFMINSSSDEKIIEACMASYERNLDADCLLIFNKKLREVTLDEAKIYNQKLKIMTPDQLKIECKGKRISLAAKWFPREGHKDSNFRRKFLERLYPDIMLGNKFKRTEYASIRFRHIITTLTQLLNVGEQMMCATDGRNWADISIEHAPAGFVNKYRKALLNELLDAVGVRSTRLDRIKCRENTLVAALNGKLKGANCDLSKLSRIIFDSLNKEITHGERSLINQQWNDMVKSVKERVDLLVKENENNSDFIDPRNVIPIVDTSGSMGSANVQHIAIGLGILASSLSNLPGCLISFSERPEMFKLDPTHDVFDKFQTIVRGPTGLSTNIDATYRLLLDVMVKNKVTKSDFALLILTDGQFDSGLVNGVNDVFITRMEKAFKEKGYNLPRTIFWNLNGRKLGFQTTETMKGIQAVSGFSQTLMEQVFTGEYTLVLDETTGETRIDVSPWESFLKAITNEVFNPILAVALNTKEGAMA